MQISQIYITDDNREPNCYLQECIETVKKYYCVGNNTHVLYNKTTLRKFIEEKFDKDVLWAYDCLKPYAYKTDLGKYCILYALGGWYLDVTLEAINYPFVPKNVTCILFRDTQTKHYIFSNCSIANNIMYSEPGNQLFLDAINQIVQNCKNNYYGLTPVCVTGPNMLGKIASKYTPCEWIYFGFYDKKTFQDKSEKFCNFGFGDLILTVSKGTISLNGLGEKTNNYAEMWKNKEVYFDLAPTTPLRNLYRFILQREPDNEGILSYNHKNFNEIKNILLNSEEHINLKQNTTTTNKPNLPYAIISINDRAKNNIENTKTLLKNFQYHNLKYFNGHVEDNQQFFKSRQIDLRWNKELFKRDVLIGELGTIASQILILEYILKNDIEEMIVFEDDAVIDDNFLTKFYQCYNDLPKDWDYLTECYDFPHHTVCEQVTKNILINSTVICKSDLLNAHLGFVFYSNKGAKKLLNALKYYGFTMPFDRFIYHLARENYLNGYTTFFKNRLITEKDNYGTLADPNNIRK